MSRAASSPALAALLAAASALIACGIGWGLPAPSGWDYDEVAPHVVEDCLAAGGAAGGWRIIYPPFHLLVVAGPYLAAAELGELLRLRPAESYHLAYRLLRSVSVVMATATVWLVYRSGRRLFDPVAGLLAAAIAATSLPLVYYGKLNNLDVPYVFWFALSLLAFLRLLDHHRPGDYVACAVTAALAVATKDQAFALYTAAPVLALAGLWRHLRSAGGASLGRLLGDRRVALGAVSFAVTYALAAGLVTDPGRWLGHARAVVTPGKAYLQAFPNTPAGQLGLAATAGRTLAFSLGWPAFVACLAGIPLALARPGRRFAALAVLGLAAGYHLSLIAVIRIALDRYLMGPMLVLALFGGLALARLGRSAALPRPVGVAVVAAVVAWGVLRAAALDALLLHDSRYALAAWSRDVEARGRRVLAVGRSSQGPRVDHVEWPVALRGGSALVESLAADYLVFNVTDLRKEGEQAFYRGVVGRDVAYELHFRLAGEPGFPLYRTREAGVGLDGAQTNLSFVSPELAVFHRVDGFDGYLRLARGDPARLAEIAAGKRQSGQADLACRLDLEALEREPGFAPAAHGLARDSDALGWPDESIGWLREAIRLAPEWPEPRRELVRALERAGRLGEAAAAAVELKSLEPQEGENWLLAGRLQGRVGRRSDAVRDLERAAAVGGAGDAGLLADVARALLDLGARQRAARTARHALAAAGAGADAAVAEAAAVLGEVGEGEQPEWARVTP